MKLNRRNFIQKIAVTASGTLIAPTLWSNAQSEINSLSIPDWNQISSDFPVSDHSLYFNNGTMGPSPKPVIDAFVQKINFVDRSGNYGDTDLSRKKIAEFIGAAPSEISLTHNTTEGINIICWGLPLKKGDEILLSDHEHVGGALPWLNRAKIDKLKVEVFRLGKDAAQTITNIKKKVTNKTRVIAVPHITCTTGQLQPIKDLNIWAKSLNITLVVDGAHGMGLMPLNMKELGIDYYVSCCHKWLCAPKGTGFIYVKQSVLDNIQAKFVGAGSDTGWNVNFLPYPSIKGYAPTAHRYDYGTQNTSLWAGVNAAIDYFNKIGMDFIYQRNKELTAYFMDRLKENKKFTILTPTNSDDYLGMVSFKHSSKSYTDINTIAAKEKIRLRVMPEHGLDCIRASFHLYNSTAQIDQLLETLFSIG